MYKLNLDYIESDVRSSFFRLDIGKDSDQYLNDCLRVREAIKKLTGKIIGINLAAEMWSARSKDIDVDWALLPSKYEDIVHDIYKYTNFLCFNSAETEEDRYDVTYQGQIKVYIANRDKNDVYKVRVGDLEFEIERYCEDGCYTINSDKGYILYEPGFLTINETVDWLIGKLRMKDIISFSV